MDSLSEDVLVYLFRFFDTITLIEGCKPTCRRLYRIIKESPILAAELRSRYKPHDVPETSSFDKHAILWEKFYLVRRLFTKSFSNVARIMEMASIACYISCESCNPTTSGIHMVQDQSYNTITLSMACTMLCTFLPGFRISLIIDGNSHANTFLENVFTFTKTIERDGVLGSLAPVRTPTTTSTIKPNGSAIDFRSGSSIITYTVAEIQNGTNLMCSKHFSLPTSDRIVLFLTCDDSIANAHAYLTPIFTSYGFSNEKVIKNEEPFGIMMNIYDDGTRPKHKTKIVTHSHWIDAGIMTKNNLMARMKALTQRHCEDVCFDILSETQPLFNHKF